MCLRISKLDQKMVRGNLAKYLNKGRLELSENFPKGVST